MIGALYIMGRGKGWFAKKFIPRLKVDELPPPSEEPGLLEPLPLGEGEGTGASRPSSQHCPFCRIAQGEAPCYRIYEDEYTLAFLDTAGDVEGHTLVIPKVHVETIDHCPEEIALQLAGTVRLVSEHYVKDCGYDGVNILSASGKTAQQSVPHLHFHILPRKQEDGLNAWPRLGKDHHDLQEVAKRLRIARPENP